MHVHVPRSSENAPMKVMWQIEPEHIYLLAVLCMPRDGRGTGLAASCATAAGPLLFLLAALLRSSAGTMVALSFGFVALYFNKVALILCK